MRLSETSRTSSPAILGIGGSGSDGMLLLLQDSARSHSVSFAKNANKPRKEQLEYSDSDVHAEFKDRVSGRELFYCHLNTYLARSVRSR